MKQSVSLEIHRDYPIMKSLSQSLTAVFPVDQCSQGITASVKRIESLT